MNVNVTCCTVADSAGAVLAEVTVMFTFVPSHKQMSIFFKGEGRGASSLREGRHGKMTLTSNDASELHYIQRLMGVGDGGAGNDDMCVRVCVGGRVVLSRHQLLRQPSARRRTIHSIMTRNLNTLS